MPLMNGTSRAVVSENIREMVNAGHPQDQAVAAALQHAGKGRKKPKTSKTKTPRGRKSGIHINPAHKGMLHEDLGVPQGQPISEGAEEEAAENGSPAVRKRAQFALNARKFNH